MSFRTGIFGFGSGGSKRGKPATVKTPKLYDFTGGKRPSIPEEERAPVVRQQAGQQGKLPQPEVYDFTKNRR